MGTAFRELMRCLPSSRVITSPASRSTSRCFMTPKRESCGNAFTSSVVAWGPRRKRSSNSRRVGSERAFHTGSRSSGMDGRGLFAVSADVLQDTGPTRLDAFLVRGVEQSEGAMTEGEARACRDGFQFDLDVIERRI